jgi:hypothetical protein
MTSQSDDFNAVFDDFMSRYDAAGDAAKTVAIRCAAKVMCTDTASAAEIHAALALLDRLPEKKKAAGPQALTVTFVSPEPTEQEYLRERAERESAALRSRVAELEKVVAAFNRSEPHRSSYGKVVSLPDDSPHTPDWSALAAVNSRGGVTVNDPNVRIRRLSDDAAANKIAR